MKMTHGERDRQYRKAKYNFGEFLLFMPIVLLILGLVLVVAYPTKSFGQTAEIERAEFDGIRFKTPYHVAKINTPILVEMDLQSRLLKFALKNPDTAKFNFLLKITPGTFEGWQKLAELKAKDIFLTNSRTAHFLSKIDETRTRITMIGEVTINTENFQWMEKYKPLIEKNFGGCTEKFAPSGIADVICRPLLIEAKVVRIERSSSGQQEAYLTMSGKKERLNTGTPMLPEKFNFPYLDYIDIFIEILDIKEF
jgi:hypothetical protein